jgi:hypothetical protein
MRKMTLSPLSRRYLTLDIPYIGKIAKNGLYDQNTSKWSHFEGYEV